VNEDQNAKEEQPQGKDTDQFNPPHNRTLVSDQTEAPNMLIAQLLNARSAYGSPVTSARNRSDLFASMLKTFIVLELTHTTEALSHTD
jgi:hypothetical protein